MTETGNTRGRQADDGVIQAGQEALEQIKNARSLEIIYNSNDVRLPHHAAHQCSIWIHGPGQAEILSEARDALLTVTELQGDPATEISHLRAARVKGQKVMYLIPVRDDDPHAILVGRGGDTWTVNLTTFLTVARWRVPSGFKIRYAAKLESESPVGPALRVDLSKALERTVDPSSSKNRRRVAKGKVTAGSPPTPAVPDEEDEVDEE